VGAVFAVPLVRASVPEVLDWRRCQGVPLVGTSPAAAIDYRAARYRPPTALLMGSERHGLPPALQAACDLVVRIPMAGRSDSLNLAVATALVLYALHADLAGSHGS
jgi:TrmH family RNA methyltransferase